MSFIEETKIELSLAYFQLLIVNIVFCLVMYLCSEVEIKYPDFPMWFPIGISGFFVVISIIRIVLIHLSIYFWRRGEKKERHI